MISMVHPAWRLNLANLKWWTNTSWRIPGFLDNINCKLLVGLRKTSVWSIGVENPFHPFQNPHPWTMLQSIYYFHHWFPPFSRVFVSPWFFCWAKMSMKGAVPSCKDWTPLMYKDSISKSWSNRNLCGLSRDVATQSDKKMFRPLFFGVRIVEMNNGSWWIIHVCTVI